MEYRKQHAVMPALAAVWFVPAAMLIIALAPLPYGYHTLLRLVVCAAAIFLALVGHKAGLSQLWTGAMIVIALLFNPLIPVHLSRGVWAPIDVLVAVLFVAHWLAWRRSGLRRTGINWGLVTWTAYLSSAPFLLCGMVIPS